MLGAVHHLGDLIETRGVEARLGLRGYAQELPQLGHGESYNEWPSVVFDTYKHLADLTPCIHYHRKEAD
jgi:hypothetical protein